MGVCLFFNYRTHTHTHRVEIERDTSDNVIVITILERHLYLRDHRFTDHRSCEKKTACTPLIIKKKKIK